MSASGAPKRVRPVGGRRTVIGSPRDVALLEDIAALGMLTTLQAQRLAFPSRRRAQRRLRAFLDAGLVRAHLQGEAMHRDNVWTLTQRGAEFLKDRRGGTGRVRPFRPNVRSQKLRHAILVRDVAVAFLAAERLGLWRVLDVRLDSGLAETPAMREARLIPDGLARLEADAEERLVIWEVASGVQPLSQVRDKVAALARARASGPALFRSASLVVLIAVEGEARLRRLAEAVARIPGAGGFRVALVDEACAPDSLAALVAPRDSGFTPVRGAG